MTRIKQYWSRYRAWQRDPMHGRWVKEGNSADDAQGKQHRCANCGREYNGNYCPDCGQRHSVGRVTWSSIRQGVMELWGLGSRSLPYTLWQLVWRPGYLIADYIGGKRQMSFPPIKMLFLVSLFALLLSRWVGLSEVFTDASTPADTAAARATFTDILGAFTQWSSHHYDWFMLLQMSLFIVPTYFIFNHAPRCGHHNLAEGFFIQVFNATILLLFLVVFIVIAMLMEYTTINDTLVEYFDIMLISVLPHVLLWRNYHQLFGYGWWSNTWRMAAMIVTGLVTLFLLLTIAYTLILASYNEWSRVLNRLLTRIVPTGLFVIGTLYAIYRYDRNKALKATTHADNEQSEDNSPAADGVS